MLGLSHRDIHQTQKEVEKLAQNYLRKNLPIRIEFHLWR
ncbi:hypothetical protein HLRTI_000842 [Halorhabdus tiamatea SARL4B]|uniref:Uncharacterized protein n=1 Tax=Halorhabdus tiamatea SARL4B TaxID=1033806 RepID=U2FFE9_9EURY|nr:hypothetical protein HLRTI_000842 [Halorhabdus tiamatea SARL4B]